MPARIRSTGSTVAKPAIMASCAALVAWLPLSAQCVPPHYRSGQDYGVGVFVSIRRSDFTVDKLVCLGQTLRGQRPSQESFSVFFFDSDEAAAHFRGTAIEADPTPKWQRWAHALHAEYSFDSAKHEETLSIQPMGFACPTSAPGIVIV